MKETNYTFRETFLSRLLSLFSSYAIYGGVTMWDQCDLPWKPTESRFSTRLRKLIINHEFHTFGRPQERKLFQKDAEGPHPVSTDLGGGSGMKRTGRDRGIPLDRANTHGIAVELLCW